MNICVFRYGFHNLSSRLKGLRQDSIYRILYVCTMVPIHLFYDSKLALGDDSGSAGCHLLTDYRAGRIAHVETVKVFSLRRDLCCEEGILNESTIKLAKELNWKWNGEFWPDVKQRGEKRPTERVRRYDDETSEQDEDGSVKK